LNQLSKYWRGVVGLVVACAILTGATWAIKPEAHLVSVTGLNGSPVTFRTTAKMVGTALQAQGIILGEKDQVSPSLNTSLKGLKDVSVRVTKAIPVTVVADGKTTQVVTVAPTVKALLNEVSLVLGAKDSISIAPEAALTPGMQITVVRRTELVSIAKVDIPFNTVREDDRRMTVGESKEVQSGAAGQKEIKTVTYLEDGKEVKTEVVSEVVVSEPVNRVVAFGTTAVVSRGGTNMRYSRQMTLSSTGYTAGKESNPDGNGYTYTGMRAVHGVVAVDPNVIPLYTRLYIEGYGVAVAGDTGGDIKGNRIDLCFNALSEALDWGRRPVTVYVLSD
jgi:uncharacterized protein YabE (DUF348 family)